LPIGILGNVRFYQALPAERTGCILTYKRVNARSDQGAISVKAFSKSFDVRNQVPLSGRTNLPHVWKTFFMISEMAPKCNHGQL
jgi:hypothetical protein